MKFAIVLACLVASAIAAPGSWRVVGGANAAKDQFPYQVSIRQYGGQFCGGSILDATTILCAAHCVDGQIHLGMTVGVGNNKLSAQTEEYEVAKLIPHERYDNKKTLNDISLIKLKTPIKFRTGVAPVKLPIRNIGVETVTLSGWGMTSWTAGDSPDDLKFVNLKTISVDECKSWLGNDIVNTQVCTLENAGKGACAGDSGGPLVDSNGAQIGVVSFGIPCGVGYPDVFTRVYSFLDWIAANRK